MESDRVSLVPFFFDNAVSLKYIPADPHFSVCRIDKQSQNLFCPHHRKRAQQITIM